MALRSLAFLSKGMNAVSTNRAITFMSRGWLIPVIIPPPTPSEGEQAVGSASGGKYYQREEEERLKRRKQEESLILAILKGWAENYN